MIEARIPTNTVSDYKSKFLFGLTGKQVICVGITAVLIYLDFHFLSPYIGDLCVVLAAIPAAAAAAFGWLCPYGMPFEQYLQSVLLQALLAPKHRKAKTCDSFVIPCDKYYEPIPDSAVSPEVLACVQQVREKLGIVVEEEQGSRPGIRKNKRPARPKYKKSKAAYL